METDEIQSLQGMGQELAAASRSPWQPACVARTFASAAAGELHLTMQGWIDLEAIRSPLILGDHELATRDEARQAAHAFGLDLTEHEGPEIDLVAFKMEAAVRAAFSMQVEMQPPENCSTGEDGGFGNWLEMYRCLRHELHADHEGAMRERVGAVFAAIACLRENQGWTVRADKYSLREVAESQAAKEEPAHE